MCQTTTADSKRGKMELPVVHGEHALLLLDELLQLLCLRAVGELPALELELHDGAEGLVLAESTVDGHQIHL